MASDYPNPSASSPVAQTSTLALVSIISGIICWFALPVIGAIVAVVTGHMAKQEIRQSMGRLAGENLATTGLVLGYIHLGLGLITACVIAALIALGFSVLFFCIPFSNQTGLLSGILAGY